jgi:hypothetical protein
MAQLEVIGKMFRDVTLIYTEVFLLSVLGAQNLSALTALPGREGRFYVTVTSGENTWHTRSKQSVNQHVEWNEKVNKL